VGSKKRPARKADYLWAECLEIVGSSTSHNHGLLRLLRIALLLLYPSWADQQVGSLKFRYNHILLYSEWICLTKIVEEDNFNWLTCFFSTDNTLHFRMIFIYSNQLISLSVTTNRSSSCFYIYDWFPRSSHYSAQSFQGLSMPGVFGFLHQY
jgi:hypothetical protein